MIEIKTKKSIVRPSECFQVSIKVKEAENRLTSQSCVSVKVSVLNAAILIDGKTGESNKTSDCVTVEASSAQEVVLSVCAGNSGCLGITATNDTEVVGMMIEVL